MKYYGILILGYNLGFQCFSFFLLTDLLFYLRYLFSQLILLKVKVTNYESVFSSYLHFTFDLFSSVLKKKKYVRMRTIM